jgi:hypothetical protein
MTCCRRRCCRPAPRSACAGEQAWLSCLPAWGLPLLAFLHHGWQLDVRMCVQPDPCHAGGLLLLVVQGGCLHAPQYVGTQAYLHPQCTHHTST